MADESTVFADLYNGYVGNLIAGSTAAADALIGAIGNELAAALGLFVIANGVLVFLGRMQWNVAILNCVRAVAVANLLTVGLYNQWVQTIFLTTLPGWIAGAIGGDAGLGMAEQFDRLRSAIDHQAAILWAANNSWTPAAFANRMSITFAAQFDVLALWFSFLIDSIAQMLMAVVAPVGTVVMLAYLFGNTRHWAERWIGKLVALALLELLVAIELKIVMVQFQAYMGKIEAAGAVGTDAAEAISNLWAAGWAFMFGAAIMIALPAIAAAIGGGHVSNVVTTHITMAGNLAARAIGSGARPIGGAAAGAAAAATREAGRTVAGNRTLGVH
jgi:type IV secretory pathway VirB6-like protein